MQLVPIIPRQKTDVKERLEVKGIAAVKSAKPGQERTLPPLLSHGRERSMHASGWINQYEKRQVTPLGELRLVCRRLNHLSILEELCSAVDRHSHKRRSADLQLHIDEEV